MITLSDFQKLDLRVATIIDIKPHSNAEKLYVLKVNLGSEIRQLVAGIKKYYTEKELLNKQIIVITNLEPAKLRGIESNGMLLAAENGEKVVLLTPDKKIENNSKIK